MGRFTKKSETYGKILEKNLDNKLSENSTFLNFSSEQDLDVKLVSFSRLGTNHLSASSSFGITSDKTSLLDENGNPQIDGSNQNDDMFKTMAMEIQSLLEKLTSINQELSDFSQKNSQNSNSYGNFL